MQAFTKTSSLKQEQSCEESSSLRQAIRKKLLGTDASRFADITLVSADKTKFPVVRALLAVRSDYFHAGLYSSYAESGKTEYHLSHIPAIALENIIQFVYTDECDLLEQVRAATTVAKSDRVCNLHRSTQPWAFDGTLNDLCSVKKEDVEGIIELILAADYLLVQTLTKKAIEAMVELVEAVPSVACLVLETAHRYPGAELIMPEVLNIVRKAIQREPAMCLLAKNHPIAAFAQTRNIKKRPRIPTDSDKNKRVKHADTNALALSSETLREVLADKDLFANESLLFEVLHFWATGGEYLSPVEVKQGAESDNKQRAGCTEGCRRAAKFARSRWEEAKLLSRELKLDSMTPSFLCQYIEPCGLVDSKKLRKAYRDLALQGEQGRTKFVRCRGESRWKNGSRMLVGVDSQLIRTHILGTAWLYSGKHQWTFRLQEGSTNVWVGLTSDAPEGYCFFPTEDTGWGYCTTGVAMHGGSRDRSKDKARIGPRIENGQNFKLILNLESSGTMSIVVDDEVGSYGIFRNLKPFASKFIPAVSLTKPSRMILVAEEHSFG